MALAGVQQSYGGGSRGPKNADYWKLEGRPEDD